MTMHGKKKRNGSCLPVSMSMPRNATVKGVVYITRKNIPAARFGSFEQLSDGIKVDVIIKQCGLARTEIVDADFVDVVIERRVGRGEEWCHLVVNVQVGAEWHRPGGVVIVGGGWPGAGAVFVNKFSQASSCLVTFDEVGKVLGIFLGRGGGRKV